LKPIWHEVANELLGGSHLPNQSPSQHSLTLLFFFFQGHTSVAAVDGDQQLDLVARFGVQGYPTLVHVRGSAVRVFAGERSKSGILAFARGGYASLPPLSFWQSPVSLVGDAIGLVTTAGFYVTVARDWLLASEYPFPVVVLAGIAALLAVALLLSLVTVWCLSIFDAKPKRD
jgi:hypothetical protein